MTRVVGILGGIGSGKSAVSRLLREAGAVVLSGDAIGHAALKEPDIKRRIVERWGEAILKEDGEIERRKLGAIVFGEEKERLVLESMVHPWIKQRLREEVAEARKRPGVSLIVVDAAIMIEAGWDDTCDELIFVDVPRPIRLQRIERERGWSEKEVAAREQAQMPLTEKARRAHYMVNNAGSLDDLRHQVNALLTRWGLVRASPLDEAPPTDAASTSRAESLP